MCTRARASNPKNPANIDRLYDKCPRGDAGCGYFKWRPIPDSARDEEKSGATMQIVRKMLEVMGFKVKLDSDVCDLTILQPGSEDYAMQMLYGQVEDDREVYTLMNSTTAGCYAFVETHDAMYVTSLDNSEVLVTRERLLASHNVRIRKAPSRHIAAVGRAS